MQTLQQLTPTTQRRSAACVTSIVIDYSFPSVAKHKGLFDVWVKEDLESFALRALCALDLAALGHP